MKLKNGISSQVILATDSKRPLFEFSAEQKEKISTIAGTALVVIGLAGVITIAAAAPNLFIAIDKIYRLGKYKGKRLTFKQKQEKISRTFYYLRKHGLIKITLSPKGFLAKLTEKGEKKLVKLSLSSIRIVKPKVWDRAWWLVAADIPTKQYRWAADLFRIQIKQLGFYPLQRTLWIHPYYPVEEVKYLTEYFGIAKFVTAMEISRLDQDDEAKLKKFFNL